MDSTTHQGGKIMCVLTVQQMPKPKRYIEDMSQREIEEHLDRLKGER